MKEIRPHLVIFEERRLQKNREPKIDFRIDFRGLRDPSIVSLWGSVLLHLAFVFMQLFALQYFQCSA